MQLTRFARLFGDNASGQKTLENFLIPIASDEVAILDADPNFPEHGVLTLTLRGGTMNGHRYGGAVCESAAIAAGAGTAHGVPTGLAPPANRPGLQQLHVRIGDYRDFLLNAIMALTRAREANNDAQG